MRRYSLFVLLAALALMLLAIVPALGGGSQDDEDATTRSQKSATGNGQAGSDASDSDRNSSGGGGSQGDDDNEAAGANEGGGNQAAGDGQGGGGGSVGGDEVGGGSEDPEVFQGTSIRTDCVDNGSGTAAATRTNDCCVDAARVTRTNCPPPCDNGAAVLASSSREGCDTYGNVPMVTAYPNRLRQGQPFFAVWEGCGVGETVRFYIVYTFVGSATTNADSRALAILTVPTGGGYGRKKLTAICGPLFAQTDLDIVPNLILSKTTFYPGDFFTAELYGCEPHQPVAYKVGSLTVRQTNAPYYGGPFTFVLGIPKGRPPGPTTVSATCGSNTWSVNIQVIPKPLNVSSSRDTSPADRLPLVLAVAGFAIVGIYLSPRRGRARRT